MKNILYISNSNWNKETGVKKKIISEIKALEKLQNNVSYIEIIDNDIYYYKDKKLSHIKKISQNKILRQIQILNENIKILKKRNDLDYIYMRYMFTTPRVLKLLKIAKKKKIKVVEEIPTYPYDIEIKNNKRIDLKLALAIDKFFRKKLKKYLVKMITFSEDNEIFGIETIIIDNGIDLDKIKPINIQYTDNEINMIGVASIEYWQGYDRIIKSLKRYYEQKNEDEPKIIIHLIGEGTEMSNLKKLAESLGISEYIIFYGFLSGKDLEKIYEKCQCGIAGLGIFRKNIKSAKTLKVREYMARAIPFIYSTVDYSITDCKYAYKISDDEKIFDMKDVIKFLKSLKQDNIKIDMRSFAEKKYRWEEQMKKVISNI